MAKLTNPCNKTVAVFDMLRSGKDVKFADIVSRMGCKEITVMTYICSLRNNFGADIQTVRDGRKVVAYRLDNAGAVAPKMVTKSSVRAASKTPKAAKPIVAKVAVTKSRKTVATKSVAPADEIPTLDIEEVNDNELASLKAELGLSESYSE